MAFSFTKARGNDSNKATAASNANGHGNGNCNRNSNNNNSNSNSNNNLSAAGLSPNKLSSSQLNKCAKLLYPTWLKDSPSCLKQLPGVYHGVLGQVQLQPMLSSLSDSKDGKFSAGLDKLLVTRQHQKTDYLNRLTDTERVHQLLSTSRLTNDQLATIWAHVNKTFPGQLTNREVCLALALIAIFQRQQSAATTTTTTTTTTNAKDGRLPVEEAVGVKNDPFALVKLEKKAPVPILYPHNNDGGGKCNKLPTSSSNSRLLANSNSVPTDLGTCLLIDITSETDQQSGAASKSALAASANLLGSEPISLLDDDAQSCIDLVRLRSVWLRCMNSMKALFKRSFDILNVENSRSSALEALKTDEGVAFCKNLCLCYPIAHNIAFKIDELFRFQERTLARAAEVAGRGGNAERQQVVDKNYATSISDLMISINEYWAVLINLFHESGLTNFIELIMDGLNRSNATLSCADSLPALLHELDAMGKRDLCSLCQTRFYLVNIGDALDKRDICKLDLELVLNNELLTDDSAVDSTDENNGDHDDDEGQCYFYHVKCANFWLNNVPDNERGQLPFRRPPRRRDETILRPTTTVSSSSGGGGGNLA